MRQKLRRLITQAQSYALRVLYDTYDLRLFCFLGTTDQTSSAFVRKLSQVNEKPMIIIIISVCSQMITYKAVKANSWLQCWFAYSNIENRQAIWLWWRSEWAQLYSCRGYHFLVCVVVSFNICFARQSCVAQVDCFLFIFSLSFSMAFDRPIICSFSLLQKTDSLSIICNAGF